VETQVDLERSLDGAEKVILFITFKVFVKYC